MLRGALGMDVARSTAAASKLDIRIISRYTISSRASSHRSYCSKPNNFHRWMCRVEEMIGAMDETAMGADETAAAAMDGVVRKGRRRGAPCGQPRR
jgi:hypothetical protein